MWIYYKGKWISRNDIDRVMDKKVGQIYIVVYPDNTWNNEPLSKIDESPGLSQTSIAK